MSKRLSSHATSLADRLVLHIHNATAHTRTKADLETWWKQRQRVHRLELFRLLSDLVDEGRLFKHGSQWTTEPPAKEVPLPPHLKQYAPKRDAEKSVNDEQFSKSLINLLDRLERAAASERSTREDRPVPAAGTVPARILATLRRGRRTTGDLIERLDLLAPTARGRLSELARDGWITKDDDGKWSVVA